MAPVLNGRRSFRARSPARNTGLGIGSMSIRKTQAYRPRMTDRRRGPMFADRNQVSVLTKGINLLSGEASEASGEDRPAVTPKKAPMRVAVRVRPLNARESTANAREIISVSGHNMLVFDPERQQEDFFYRNQKIRDVTARKFKNLKFAFDHVYDANGTNAIIYEDIMKPLLDTLMSGFNCSVFAYGATGSGKTYTMLGSQGNPGLTYLTINDLYERLGAMKEDFETEVVISYFEVYNEQVKDLLNPSGKQLQIMEVGTGIEIKDLSFHHPTDIQHLLQLLHKGNSYRSQHPTDHNAESSRSHAVLQVHIRLRERHKDMNSSSKTSKLVMVDLAGSEKGCATGFSGQRFREGSSINKSLLALGKIMEALASGKRTFSFRDSKLTRILKDSLGGNCRTVMIANISPAESLYEDTLNTLRYAQKAKKISCNATKNVITVQSCLTEYTRVCNEMTTKIQGLEKQLKEKDELLEEREQQLDEKDEKIRALEKKIQTTGECEMDQENYKALLRKLADTENKLQEAETKLKIQEEQMKLPVCQEQYQMSEEKTLESSVEMSIPASTTIIIKNAYINSNGDMVKEVDMEDELLESVVPPFEFVKPDAVEEREKRVEIQRYCSVECPMLEHVNSVKELERHLQKESAFNGTTQPKLEKFLLDFQLKLDQYQKLKGLNDATGDHRYEKAMNKAIGKLENLIKAVEKSLRDAREHYKFTLLCGLPFASIITEECRISTGQLWHFFINQSLLRIAANENKVLHQQVDNLTSQLTRKEDLLKDFAALSNKMHNSLNFYNQLAPCVKDEYDKLVSAYCSPSLKFEETSRFIRGPDCTFFRREKASVPPIPERNIYKECFERMTGNYFDMERSSEISRYITDLHGTWTSILSLVEGHPKIKDQVENLLQHADVSKWVSDSQNTDEPFDYSQVLNMELDFSVASVDTVADGPAHSRDRLNQIFEDLVGTDCTDGGSDGKSLSLNKTFTLPEEEEEIKENEIPLSHCSNKTNFSTATPSSGSDIFDLKTVPEAVAEFSGRLGAKQLTTPPTQGSELARRIGPLNYNSPGTSPSSYGPGRIPVLTRSPRSASPHRTYQASIGAKTVSRSSAGRVSTSPKLLVTKSPYAKSKKVALKNIRSHNLQYRYVGSAKTKTNQKLLCQQRPKNNSSSHNFN